MLNGKQGKEMSVFPCKPLIMNKIKAEKIKQHKANMIYTIVSNLL